jgi:hypothetical protein
MKLISMTDFVLETEKESEIENWNAETDEYFNRCVKYANFLKQPITLGMFIPVDENNNVLEEPSGIGVGNEFYLERAIDQYQEAKENVVFEVGELIDKKTIDNYLFHCEIVEDLLVYNKNLTLTNNQIKKLGL